MAEVVGLDHAAGTEPLEVAGAVEGTKPIVLICHTINGKGVSFLEGGREWHLGNLVAPGDGRVMAEPEDDAGEFAPRCKMRLRCTVS